MVQVRRLQETMVLFAAELAHLQLRRVVVMVAQLVDTMVVSEVVALVVLRSYFFLQLQRRIWAEVQQHAPLQHAPSGDAVASRPHEQVFLTSPEASHRGEEELCVVSAVSVIFVVSVVFGASIQTAVLPIVHS